MNEWKKITNDKKHRKYLRFCFQNQVYQFRALCFGPTVSPRLFTKVVVVVTAHLHRQSIRLASYLDDWLAVNQLRRMLLQNRDVILNLLFHLEFIVNKDKSVLLPYPEVDINRGSISFKNRSCLSYRNKGKKFEESNKNDIKRAENCKTVSCSSPPDCTMSTTHSKCQTIHETQSVTFTETLEFSQNGYVCKNSID